MLLTQEADREGWDLGPIGLIAHTPVVATSTVSCYLSAHLAIATAPVVGVRRLVRTQENCGLCRKIQSQIAFNRYCISQAKISLSVIFSGE